MTGCKALEGCEKKDHCLRYQFYLDSTPYVGWSSHQQCRISQFTEKVYPFFLAVESPGVGVQAKQSPEFRGMAALATVDLS